MKRLFRNLVAFGLLVLLTGSARADYGFTTLDVPGASYTAANGINDAGQIVGFYVMDGTAHGFLLGTDGVYITLDVPNATRGTGAYGINNAGQIVGSYAGSEGLGHGFLLSSDGTYTTLDVPGGIYSNAFGINDSGQIVGQYSGAGGMHGFVLTHGVYTAFDLQGALDTQLTGINNQGVLLGNITVDDGLGNFPNYGFYFVGLIEAVFVPGAVDGSIYSFGINDAVNIVGFYGQSDGSIHGYVVSEEGDFANVDVPDAQITYAYGINNYGVIVGNFSDQQNQTHGFVATPQ